MTPEEIAQDAKDQIADAPWEDNFDPKQETRGVYLGSVFTLDPCGSYHPEVDGHPKECEAFWVELESELAKLDLTLETGEGDACDKYATEHRNRDESRTEHEIIEWLKKERLNRVATVKRLKSDLKHGKGTQAKERALHRAEVDVANIDAEIALLEKSAA